MKNRRKIKEEGKVEEERGGGRDGSNEEGMKLKREGGEGEERGVRGTCLPSKL